MTRLLLSLILVFNLYGLQAQQPNKPNTSEIYESLRKLNFLGSVLYVAAHPDDENTRLISYFSNETKARTAYLSITRGDGGQNLIGPELQELLGVIRTQELLAARRIDGGEQFFTRAYDFGYSKHPDETLDIWNKEEVLKDVVSIIRKFKPDIIINRFDHRTPGSTHGHHTSSAILSTEAFELVGDRNFISHDNLDVWQPKRLFYNTSWWFYGSQEKFAEADKSKMLNFDIGVYYPTLGKSNNEIASLASSQHLCQGFGRLSTRGSDQEYLEILKGDMPKVKTDIFEGINTTWTRVKGGDEIGKILDRVEKNFNFKQPSLHLSDLLKAYQLVQKIDDQYWRDLKTKELSAIIEACAGLYLETSANESSATKAQPLELTIEALNRSSAQVILKKLAINDKELLIKNNLNLENNKKEIINLGYGIASSAGLTAPYWLKNKREAGMYQVDDKSLIGLPETPRALWADFHLTINGLPIIIKKPVVYRYSKPDKGELYKPFEIVPEVSVSIQEKVIVFNSDAPKEITVQVKALRDSIKGTLKIDVPQGWTLAKFDQQLSLDRKGEEKLLHILLKPTSFKSEGSIMPSFNFESQQFANEMIEINYEHIPAQTVLMPSETRVIRLDLGLKTNDNKIGYIHGAGDLVPEGLRQMGYHVIELNPELLQPEQLQGMDAVVMGIRAYNIVDALQFKQEILLDFVHKGGNLIVQYNTSRGINVPNLAPYPLELSRDRVTNELAEVRILAPDHELLNRPNKITAADFEGWIQERGLYFPGKWSKEFTALLSMNDPGEAPSEGSILVAKYGKGNYIYTGLSFFRELPAGVSGAFKLFDNMISLGKSDQN